MIAELLSDLSEWTWHFLRDAPFRPREETITETLLTEFSRLGKGYVWVRKSTTGEEEADGLDWAWAIRTNAGWLTALVQAKNVGGQRFAVYLELRKPDAVDQVGKLLHAAGIAQALPLFAFYNSELPPFGSEGNRIDMGGCALGQLERAYEEGGLPWSTGQTPLGVSLAHGEDIRDFAIPAPAANQRAATVNLFAMPWECLLCPNWAHIGPDDIPAEVPDEAPIGWQDSRIARVAAELSAALYPRPDQIDPPTGDTSRMQWLRAEPPEWVQAVRDGNDPSPDDDAPPVQYFLVVDFSEVDEQDG